MGLYNVNLVNNDTKIRANALKLLTWGEGVKLGNDQEKFLHASLVDLWLWGILDESLFSHDERAFVVPDVQNRAQHLTLTCYIVVGPKSG